MTTTLPARLRAMLVAAAIVAPWSGAHAGIETSCAGLKLQSAQGVPNLPVHEYVFRGICEVLDVKEKHTFMKDKFWAEARVRWNAAENVLYERVAMQDPDGKNGGDVISQFKCSADPIISKAGCVLFMHTNATKYKQFSDAAQGQSRPITQGKTTLDAAVALSQSAVPAAPPGGQAKAGGTPPAAGGSPPAVSAGSATAMAGQGAPVMSGAAVTPSVPDLLARSACMPSGARGGYVCTSRAGFDRCEAMRAQRQVAQCSLNERR